MNKNRKELLIEIIGAIILLALIGGIVSCNVVYPYDPNHREPPDPNEALSQAQA